MAWHTAQKKAPVDGYTLDSGQCLTQLQCNAKICKQVNDGMRKNTWLYMHINIRVLQKEFRWISYKYKYVLIEFSLCNIIHTVSVVFLKCQWQMGLHVHEGDDNLSIPI
jgi:hypothetical protein